MDVALLKIGIDQLDHANNDHWNKDGKPNVDALKGLLQDNTVTRGDVDEHFAELIRVIPSQEEVDKNANPVAEASTDVPDKPPQPADAKPKQKEASESYGLARSLMLNESVKADPRYLDRKSVIVLDIGFAGGSVRQIGEVFTFSGIPGSWMREATKEEIAAYVAWRQAQSADVQVALNQTAQIQADMALIAETPAEE